MATVEQMEKKRSRQIEQVLVGVENMAAQVAAMKVELSQPTVADRTGEIFAAIGGASVEAGKQLERILNVVAKIAGEVIIIKSEIATLTKLVETDRLATAAVPKSPVPARKAKK